MEPPSAHEPLLSIVIPAYNEARNIKTGTLPAVADALQALGVPYELVVVDDGSEDETAELVQAFADGRACVHLVREEHRGKAHAVASGALTASGRYVLFMDMDLSTSLDQIADAVRALDEGADVVVGSREAKGAVRLETPWLRRWLGKVFNYLVQVLLLPGIKDTQCGFKAFRRDVAQQLFRHLVVYGSPGGEVKGPRVTAFDVELLVLARKRGYKIREIPVTWRYVKTRNVRPVQDSYRMFREVMLVWFNKMRGKYNVQKDALEVQF